MISCKTELKLRETTNCVLAVIANDNANDNPTRIIFTIKNIRLHVPVVTLSARTIKNHQHCLAKNLEDQIIGMNIKQKVI